MPKPVAGECDAINIQRKYYADTAQEYDKLHVSTGEHEFAAHFMISAIKYLGIKSILDVGCGTGRGILRARNEIPDITVVGVEPSAELREVGHSKGLSRTELIDGDALNLKFRDRSFDLVCEFGVLHHLPDPSKAVSEMLRVARNAIFISDSNNFGQGGKLSRFAKQSLNAVNLWPLVNLIKTKGKGYSITEGDGLAYSYSIFNDYGQIKASCASVHFLNPMDAGPDLYRTASHLALLGIKRPVVD